MLEIQEWFHKITRCLDTELSLTRLRQHETLDEVVAGRTVLITGASSGIGRAAALRFGAAGATVALVARREAELRQVAAEIERLGGKPYVYPCDLTDFGAVDAMVAQVLSDHAGIDVLINNAGKSIRRRLDESYNRFHDYDRTMRLNYLAPVRLMLAFVPGMRERSYGSIVNILSIGNLAGGPGYSAYTASKAALDALCANFQVETRSDNVRFTAVFMPMVRTAMLAPNEIYRDMRALTPGQAAEAIADAVIGRPRRIAPILGRFTVLLDQLIPETLDDIRAKFYQQGL
ncbi:SDR family NAD(P)-dependent oxidoreductase [Nocardia goodfellowii]|uniref:NAD(P)-dependent dehydrogenase (Short-subunit alcohol dehydrogenase family) n=1 Tax=Nocardia goodfellowii TaxID=882446 RepID=A0ABS4QGJ2_9NOCA|nr:SDR family NAD(P)-dependent oxidoreductase [Nocardia goodfellowii]MBP2190816.1 NAD(P)-dependent dehydrogenase (short-subunit alcohol dehydrogenase family) [Nocardia goodfellowii]